MKAAILALVLTTVAPSHIRFAVFGIPVTLSAGVLIAAAEVLTFAGLVWLIVRALRTSRSSPYPRTAGRTT